MCGSENINIAWKHSFKIFDISFSKLFGLFEFKVKEALFTESVKLINYYSRTFVVFKYQSGTIFLVKYIAFSSRNPLENRK